MNYTKIKLSKNVNEAIDTKLRELLQLCQIYHVPMFASIVIENDEEKTVYDNIVYGAAAHDIELKDDQIRKHELITSGFEVIMPRDNMEINMQDLLGGEE